MSSQKTKTNGSLNGTKAVELTQKESPPEKRKSRPTITRRKNNSISAGNGSQKEYFNSKLLLKVLTEVKNGNFAVRMPIDEIGLNGKICNTMNEVIILNERMMFGFTRAGNIIGKQGKLTQRIKVPNAKGSWRTGVDSLNTLISDLVHPTIEIAHVISSVAKGNLSQEMPLEIGGHALKGEFSRIAKEVNGMIKQLNLFSMEVTRVAREVGSAGKQGGQAKVKGVAGVWKDLTDSVNQMASNLTDQLMANIDRLETANKDLDRFAFMSSHDLQEPLRKIRTFTDLLYLKYKTIFDDEGNRYISRIQKSAERMQLLIKDILEFSKVSNSKLGLTNTDLNLLMDEALTEMESTITGERARIKIDLLPSLEVNPGLMKSLFSNLIGNAIKYRKKDVDPEISIYSEHMNGTKANFN